MKVAIATPVLFEENSPFNHLIRDILGGLLQAGVEIERHIAVQDGQDDGYQLGYSEIKYVKYRRRESNHNNIFSRYLRDNMTCIKEARGIKKSDADVLFEDVSYASFWSVRAARKKGMRIVAMIQDVWPDNAVQSGLFGKKSLMYRFFEPFQRYVYRHADELICISDDIKDYIVSKGIEEKKISVIYNWGYSDDVVNISWEENRFVKKYGLTKEFYAVYAGNIGKMQNVELIVRAAKKLPDVKFLIVGDGAKKKAIEELSKGIDNVQLLPLQPEELAPHVYSAASVNIISLVEEGVKTAMPSKTAIVLSCGKPVVFCFGSQSAFGEKLKRYDAGVSVSATDEDELVAAIRNASAKAGAQKLFAECFRKTENINQYICVIIGSND